MPICLCNFAALEAGKHLKVVALNKSYSIFNPSSTLIAYEEYIVCITNKHKAILIDSYLQIIY
jgi:hypothetical protein